MNKTAIKKMFVAIEGGNLEELRVILDAHPEALEVTGEHNRNVRDKTPLMFAMQCWNINLVSELLDRGANAAARMAGGPRSSVLALCMKFAYADSANHDRWIELAARLMDAGADPNDGLSPALHNYGKVVARADLIRLVLDRGADPDRQAGNSGNTVRELVQINNGLYPDEILKMFSVSRE